MKTKSLVVVALAVSAIFSSCHQAIRVPGAVAAQPAKIERRANHGIKFGAFAVPEVKVTSNKGGSLKVSLPFASAEKINIRVLSQLSVQKGGALLGDLSCESKLAGKMGVVPGFTKDQTSHTLECSGSSMALSITEIKHGDFEGSLTLNGKIFLLTGTNAMAAGPSNGSVAGFHVYDQQVWLGSVENFYGGLAYPSATMPQEDSDAFGVSVVLVAALGDFLGQDAQRIQSAPW
jgi:hypothetical protein